MVSNTISTAEQLLAAGDIGRCELIRGELTMMSPASAYHGDIANNLAYLLTDHVKKLRLGKVFAAETGFLLAKNPDTVRAPDVAFVKADRAGLMPEQGYFPGPPDLAIEVLSPNDPTGEVLDKISDWLRLGTIEVWIVDPARKTIATHSKDRASATLTGNSVLTCESLLPGFRVTAADIFR